MLLCVCSGSLFTTYRKQNEVFLIVLSHTVIDPRTVMIHLSNATLANRTVMCTLWLDTTAFRALEYNLTFTETHLFDHFFCCIPLWNCTLYFGCIKFSLNWLHVDIMILKNVSAAVHSCLKKNTWCQGKDKIKNA